MVHGAFIVFIGHYLSSWWRHGYLQNVVRNEPWNTMEIETFLQAEQCEHTSLWLFFYILFLLWYDVVIFIGPVLYSENIIQTHFLSVQFFHFFPFKAKYSFKCMFYEYQQPTAEKRAKKTKKHQKYIIIFW